MSRAIVLKTTGDASVLQLVEHPVPSPGPGEALIRQTAIGLNFIDVYQRSGLYPLQLPLVIGQEGAGVVEAVGANVDTVVPGDRVAYAGVMGAYAERRTIAADRLVKLPEGLSDELAASVMLKGMTAETLVRRATTIERGTTVLVHAAAGGVGQIATQWARHLGARVIGAVGSREKASIAVHTCDEVVVTSEPTWVQTVKSLTEGKGVDVVLDSVGKDTFDGSIEVLRTRGMLATFGQSSGKVPPLDVLRLSPKSLFLTRPTMNGYTSTRSELEASSSALFDVLQRGAVKVQPPKIFALADAAEAHRALEGRQTTGSVVLKP